MSDTQREIEEWFKEFREHNIDAIISYDIRQNIKVLDIDTSKHDAKVRADFSEWLNNCKLYDLDDAGDAYKTDVFILLEEYEKSLNLNVKEQ